MNVIIVFGLGSVVFGMTSQVQRNCVSTVAELVQRLKPSPVVQNRIIEVEQRPFEELVAGTDLIIRGTVQRIGVFVSPDGCELNTDSTLTRWSLISGRFRSAAEPGPSLVVRQRGGQTVIDGTEVIFRYAHLPPLETGQDVILLLSRSKSDGIYRIVGGFAGAFEVSNGRARALSSDVRFLYPVFSDMELAEFIAHIKSMRRH